MFAPHTERCATCSQNLHARTVFEDHGYILRGCRYLLEVIKQEKQPLFAQMFYDPGQQWLCSRFLDPEAHCNFGRDRSSVCYSGEIDDKRAIGKVRQQYGGCLQREQRRPTPAWTRQGHKTNIGTANKLAYFLQCLFSTNQGGDLGG